MIELTQGAAGGALKTAPTTWTPFSLAYKMQSGPTMTSASPTPMGVRGWKRKNGSDVCLLYYHMVDNTYCNTTE